MAAPKPGILSLAIRDKSALYASYMPFIKNGGLFIPTTRDSKLGDEVFLLLTLMDSAERLPVARDAVRARLPAGVTALCPELGGHGATPSVPWDDEVARLESYVTLD